MKFVSQLTKCQDVLVYTLNQMFLEAKEMRWALLGKSTIPRVHNVY